MSAMKLILWPQAMKKSFIVTGQLNLPSCSSEEAAVPDTGVGTFWCTLNENSGYEIRRVTKIDI